VASPVGGGSGVASPGRTSVLAGPVGAACYRAAVERVDVQAIVIGLEHRARKEVQERLMALATKGDTGTRRGRMLLLREATALLVGVRDRWTHGHAEGGPPVALAEGRSRFEALAGRARSRFTVEVIRNQDGAVLRRPAPPVPASDEHGVVLVTVLAASRRELPDVLDPTSPASLRAALSRLAALCEDELVAMEVVWSPADPAERVSAAALTARHPELVPLVPVEAVVLSSALLERAGFAHGFSTRQGGVSAPPFDSLDLARPAEGLPADRAAAVAENHRRLARAVGHAPARLFEVRQVHGDRVRQLLPGEEPAAVGAEEADALVSGAPGQAVGVRTADCVPILLACPDSRRVAAVHAGWRGVAQDIVGHAVRALGGRPLAAIGPHIRAASFEVAPDVASRIAAACGDPAVIVPAEPRPHADLARAVRAQLLRAGVPADQIDDVGGDTFADPSRFFSHRRDGDRAGRLLSLVVSG